MLSIAQPPPPAPHFVQWGPSPPRRWGGSDHVLLSDPPQPLARAQPLPAPPSFPPRSASHPFPEGQPQTTPQNGSGSPPRDEPGRGAAGYNFPTLPSAARRRTRSKVRARVHSIPTEQWPTGRACGVEPVFCPSTSPQSHGGSVLPRMGRKAPVGLVCSPGQRWLARRLGDAPGAGGGTEGRAPALPEHARALSRDLL